MVLYVSLRSHFMHNKIFTHPHIHAHKQPYTHIYSHKNMKGFFVYLFLVCCRFSILAVCIKQTIHLLLRYSSFIWELRPFLTHRFICLSHWCDTCDCMMTQDGCLCHARRIRSDLFWTILICERSIQNQNKMA